MEKSRVHVALIAGSESDEQFILGSEALEVLQKVVGLDYLVVSYVSADRHDEKLRTHCTELMLKGAVCFIGVAGLAPVLPGRIASIVGYSFPVIGVCTSEEGLYTIIGKPKGSPVLSTGFGVSALYNAALAACQIVALTDESIRERLEEFLSEQAERKPPKLDVELVAV